MHQDSSACHKKGNPTFLAILFMFLKELSLKVNRTEGVLHTCMIYDAAKIVWDDFIHY